MDGANATLGVVQVCMNNAWGSVCNNRFGTNDASVVCRELGFSSTGARSLTDASNRFNHSSGPVFLDHVNCLGSESRILDCAQIIPGLAECTVSEIAGVVCTGRSRHVFYEFHPLCELLCFVFRCEPVSDQQWRV